jgi:hypothetical protein
VRFFVNLFDSKVFCSIPCSEHENLKANRASEEGGYL